MLVREFGVDFATVYTSQLKQLINESIATTLIDSSWNKNGSYEGGWF